MEGLIAENDKVGGLHPGLGHIIDLQAATLVRRRLHPGALNRVLADATARVQPPTDKGKRLKIYYMTQASVCPPTFVFFVNNAQLFHFSYQRYLENQIREAFGSIDHNHAHIGALHSGTGADDAIFFNGVCHLTLAPNAGGVNKGELAVLIFNAGVRSVTRGACNIGHPH